MKRAKRRVRQPADAQGKRRQNCARVAPKMTLSGLEDKKSYLDSLSLRLDDMSPLFERQKDRKGECPACGVKENNKFYCFRCLKPLDGLQIPSVDLPLCVDILHHPQEKRSKSSALHAKVVGGDRVRVFDADEVPEYDAEKTLLIFPDVDSQLISDVDNLDTFERVVVIDSSWAKAGVMSKLPQVQGLKKVHLNEYRTIFWRGQLCGDAFLATIEAIYYFFREYQQVSGAYDGRYDNLMYLYVAMFTMVYRNFKFGGEEERRLKRLEEKQQKKKRRREALEAA